jgi:YVTN family beta-propeller protein
MNELFFMAAIFFSIAAAFLIFNRNNRKASITCAVLAVKVLVIWAVAGTGGITLLEFMAIAGAIIALVFTVAFFSSDKAASKPNLRFLIIIAALVLLAVFSSGCKSSASQLPAVTGEMKLSFVPSKIISPVKDELYIASERGKFISVYFMGLKTKKTTISTGYMPVDMLINNNKLYTANKSSNTVTIHNLETGKGINIDSGGAYPCSLAINQQKNRLYAANLGSNDVSVIDLGAATINVVKRIPVGKWPSDLYLSPDNRYLYVCCKYTNTIQVIDAEKEQPVFTKVDTGISPTKMVPLTNRDIAIINEWEYAFNHQSTIIVFDRINYSLEYDIMVEGGIFDALLSRSRRYMYITVPLKDKVVFVDMKKRQTVYELVFKDDTPRWLALSEDKKTLYVACQHTQKIFTISLNGML